MENKTSREETRNRAARIKRNQQAKIGCICPCGKRYPRPTQSHHLFVRRNPDIPELWDEINIIQVHPWCNCNESFGWQLQGAIRKLETYGPERIEAWVAGLPFKVPATLPKFYWDAKKIYLGGRQDDAPEEKRNGSSS